MRPADTIESLIAAVSAALADAHAARSAEERIARFDEVWHRLWLAHEFALRKMPFFVDEFVRLRLNVERDLIDVARQCYSIPEPASDRGVRVVMIDTETTGLAAADEPITIGFVVVDADRDTGEVARVLGEFETRREPSRQISPGAFAVHGITAESLRGMRFTTTLLAAVLSSSRLIVAHNADFDRRMLAGVITSSGSYRWACSLRDLRTAWRVHGVSKLDDLCRVHGIARPAKHGALADCQALTELLAKPNMTWPGKTHLGELLVLSSA